VARELARSGQMLRRAATAAARHRRSVLVILALAAGSIAHGQWPGRPTAGNVALSALEAHWGVKPVWVRYSATGYVLDFRYRIVDPIKAQPLVDRRVTPHLIDEASGQRLGVPSFPTIGPLRQTTRGSMPEEGRTYFVLFANPGRLVQPGRPVTIEIGDFRASGLIVG
jgi:hypothetical protein